MISDGSLLIVVVGIENDLTSARVAVEGLGAGALPAHICNHRGHDMWCWNRLRHPKWVAVVFRNGQMICLIGLESHSLLFSPRVHLVFECLHLSEGTVLASRPLDPVELEYI